MKTSDVLTPEAVADEKLKRMIRTIAHGIVLLLSLGLIVFISYDTFQQIDFLQNRVYMNFQFWVCVIFMADFFLEWWLAEPGTKLRYLASRWFFFLISIPWLNLMHLTNADLPQHTLYFLRFIPLVRGAYSLALVVGAVSSNRALNLLASYAAILASIIYFASLIFFEQEYPVNSDVTSYWSALWWAGMNVTTIGCYINPMTLAGKVCAVTLAACGMLMLPLFTVFVSNSVKAYNDRQRREELDSFNVLESSRRTIDKADSANGVNTASASASEASSEPTAARNNNN